MATRARRSAKMKNQLILILQVCMISLAAASGNESAKQKHIDWAVHRVDIHIAKKDRSLVIASSIKDPLVAERFLVDGKLQRHQLSRWIESHLISSAKPEFKAYFEHSGVFLTSSISDIIIEAWVAKSTNKTIDIDNLINTKIELEKIMRMLKFKKKSKVEVILLKQYQIQKKQQAEQDGVER